jgi:predicted Zn-dependent peptidase
MQENRLTLSLLVNILGGAGMNSRLNLNIREKYGLAYNIESVYTPYSDTGVFTTYFGCDAKDLDKCIRLCRAEMNRLCHVPLGQIQLKKAKIQMIGQLTLASENYESQMLSIGKSFLIYGKVDPLEIICEGIEAIQANQLQQVAQDILAEQQQSVLIYK